jgi:hypothetical protein
MIRYLHRGLDQSVFELLWGLGVRVPVSLGGVELPHRAIQHRMRTSTNGITTTTRTPSKPNYASLDPAGLLGSDHY